MKIPLSLIYAAFFFVDIVGLAKPVISVRKQIKKIETLNTLIGSCRVFKKTDENLMMCLPTGDGMAIGFLQGPELPLKLAIELHKKLNDYNRGKAPEEILRIRIGLNDGPVFIVNDVRGNRNIWGPGIILARRVMDIGDDGHILLTEKMGEALRELSDEYKQLIKELRVYSIKHDQKMKVYSVYGNGIGNPNVPVKDAVQPNLKMKESVLDRLNTVYNIVDVTLNVTNQKSMLIHHKRVYGIENVSDKPITAVVHGIATDVPKSFVDLNIRTFDESENNLRITSINLDNPYQKEFTTAFRNPICQGDKDRSYTLEYDVEETQRYFENYFSINCKKYNMSMVYPANASFKPVVYDVNVEKGSKTKSRVQPKIRKIRRGWKKATWTRNNVMETQAFRLEW